MTTDRDFDRIARAWLDLMPDEVPDRVLAAVSQAVATTPQVRRPFDAAFRRVPHMKRSLFGALAAAAIVAVIGLSTLAGIGRRGSTPTPLPSASPAGTPLVPGLAPGLGFPAPAPDVLAGATWIAEVDVIQGLFHDARIRLAVQPGGRQIAVIYQAQHSAQVSQAVTGPPASLSVVSVADGNGCAVGDYGVYGLASATDGATLTLTLVSDDCGPRASLLTRTWTREIDTGNTGGRGVTGSFSPSFLITLPAAKYKAEQGIDWFKLESDVPGRTLAAFHNPAGWTAPCSEDGGSKLPIEPTIAAFTAYLQSLPGFTVEFSDLTIDGHPAVVLTVPSVKTADCPGNRVNEWTTSDPTDNIRWFLGQGDTDVIYLVDVDGELVLLQWLGEAVTRAEEQTLFATVHFTGPLPPTAP